MFAYRLSTKSSPSLFSGNHNPKYRLLQLSKSRSVACPNAIQDRRIPTHQPRGNHVSPASRRITAPSLCRRQKTASHFCHIKWVRFTANPPQRCKQCIVDFCSNSPIQCDAPRGLVHVMERDLYPRTLPRIATHIGGSVKRWAVGVFHRFLARCCIDR